MNLPRFYFLCGCRELEIMKYSITNILNALDKRKKQKIILLPLDVLSGLDKLIRINAERLNTCREGSLHNGPFALL